MSAKPPRLASAVILRRSGEIFWVRRGEKVPFMAGFHAFVGGSVDKADGALKVKGAPGGEPPAAIACAIRECFEETGVLFASPLPDAAEREAWRKKLLEKSGTFDAMISELGLVLDGSAFTPCGHWITPPFSPVRFDTRFYLAALPEGQEATVVPGELAEGAWVEPSAALDRWEKGDALAAPPVMNAIRGMASTADTSEWPAAMTRVPQASGQEVFRIEMRKGVVLVPLRAATIPPATHTNCYVVGGNRPVVIDPGSGDPVELAKLEAVLGELALEGRKPSRIAITHHHHDHVEGVEPLARKLGIPVVAHPDSRDPLAGRVKIDEWIGDGAKLDTGDGTPPLLAIHTPGHARGHLAFLEQGTKSLLSGDLILGMGTTVVDPPDGDMEQYMKSLERLAGMSLHSLFPGHGPVLARAQSKVAEYWEHRKMREDQVLAALPGTPEELVEKIYADVPVELHPFAARSVIAHLEWLERRKEVKRAGTSWRRA